MVILNQENLVPYLRRRFPALPLPEPVAVHAIGDSEEDTSGLINYLFQVAAGETSLIVKQGRPDIRSAVNFQYRLPPDRNRLECATLRLRAPIVPQYVPQVYGSDPENHVFLMEDVSYLKNVRAELTRGTIFPELGRHCAQYAARAIFYTSEFYLETGLFRTLSNFFTNTAMRNVMESWVFLRKQPAGVNPRTGRLYDMLESSGDIMAQTHVLRHKFMTSTEALIHGDLHTSNLFADSTRMKVIDMEYTFAGPCCYDIGYLMCSLLSQYCSACCRPFPTPEDRRRFLLYILDTVCTLYEDFVEEFVRCWDADAKPHYRDCPDYRDLLTASFLPDVLGYSAIPGLSQTVGGLGYFPEFSTIQDPEARQHAVQLFFLLCTHFLVRREGYSSIGQAVEAALALTARCQSKT